MADSVTEIMQTTISNSDINVENSPFCDKSVSKRKINVMNWENNKRKLLKSQGQEYVSTKGKVVPKKERIQNEQCCSTEWCKNKNLTDSEKDRIFEEHYNLGNYNSQTAFLFGLIKTLSCKRVYMKKRLQNDTSRRTRSLEYYVRHPDNGMEMRLCKVSFLNIFAISEKRARRAAEGKDGKKCAPKMDNRGKHTNRKHIVESSVIENVKAHISSFPRYRSHYSLRDNPNKTYIISVSSVEEMYRLYCKACEENETIPVKSSMYRNVFTTNFNISFKLPRSDTCKQCDEFKGKETEEVSLQHRLHLLKAQTAYDILKDTREKSHNEDTDTLAIAVDLQQALPTPHLATETVFYLRQLWTYNFGIHFLNNETATMCVWPESTAGRGSDEIGSCLFRVLKKTINSGKRYNKLIVFSDSCAGQNKNFVIMSLFIYMVELKWFEEIEHRFLVPGHTFLPCDADFGIIEKLKRKTQYVYTPEEWMGLIKRCRKIKPFEVLEMGKNDFVSFKPLTDKLCKRQNDVSGRKLDFRKASALKFTGGHKVQVKHTYGTFRDWSIVSFQRGKGRAPLLGDLVFQRKYPEGRAIAQKKLHDILSLLKFIPPVYHSFYQKLRSDAEENNNMDVEEI